MDLITFVSVDVKDISEVVKYEATRVETEIEPLDLLSEHTHGLFLVIYLRRCLLEQFSEDLKLLFDIQGQNEF